MKTIILFYSRSRKTALVARTLAEEINADTVEIVDLTERNGPLNYLKASVDAFREQKTLIKPETVDLSNYDLVYIEVLLGAVNLHQLLSPLLTNAILG